MPVDAALVGLQGLLGLAALVALLGPLDLLGLENLVGEHHSSLASKLFGKQIVQRY